MLDIGLELGGSSIAEVSDIDRAHLASVHNLRCTEWSRYADDCSFGQESMRSLEKSQLEMSSDAQFRPSDWRSMVVGAKCSCADDFTGRRKSIIEK